MREKLSASMNPFRAYHDMIHTRLTIIMIWQAQRFATKIANIRVTVVAITFICRKRIAASSDSAIVLHFFHGTLCLRRREIALRSGTPLALSLCLLANLRLADRRESTLETDE